MHEHARTLILTLLTLLLPAGASAQVCDWDATATGGAEWRVRHADTLVSTHTQLYQALERATRVETQAPADSTVVDRRLSIRVECPVPDAPEDTNASDTTTPEGAVFADGFESGDLSAQQDGFQWGRTVNATVARDAARTGDYGLRLEHPGKADGEDSVAQINFQFGTALTEVWVEYWMRVPDNYDHRDSSGSDNNKFFQVWGGGLAGRTDSPVGMIAEVQHWRGEGDSEGIRYIPHETGDIDGFQGRSERDFGAILQSEQGQWVRWRWHLKTSSVTDTAGPFDGVVEIWKGDSLVHRDEAVPIRNDDPDRPDAFDFMRLLGWSNSGYDEATAFAFDDLRVYAQDPGW